MDSRSSGWKTSRSSLFDRVDRLRMTESERRLARAYIADAELLADLMCRVIERLRFAVTKVGAAPGPRQSQPSGEGHGLRSADRHATSARGTQ